MFEYNVNQTNRHKKDITLTTAYNLERLLSLPHKDTLHVVFTADFHRFHDDIEDMVEAINALPEVDSVLVLGDIVDFGVAREYENINRHLKKLNKPFLTVIGNHDCIANGSELYEDIYGEFNYSFTWNDVRFLAINTNSREFNFNGKVPDLNWMQQQLTYTSNYTGCIFMSHVPPGNDDFDNSLEADYAKLVRETKNTILYCNGHRHVHGLNQPYFDNIWYMNTSGPSERIYCYVIFYPYATAEKKFDCRFIAF